MVERCGDRQRKCDGLEKWPFRLIIESLPIMLQIALFLLACGLSRYMWSVDTSVARVVISFTVFGIFFYIGIVVAGTSSYECPFQTPASIALRRLRDNARTRKLLRSLSPPKILSLIRVTLRSTWQGFLSASHRYVYNPIRHPLSWNISLSHIASGIRSVPSKVGHQVSILLLWINQTLGNGKRRLAQGVRSLRRATLLPITVKDTRHMLQDGPGLQLRVWDLGNVRRQNIDNAHCVCWILWNITDPEAINSAIRLAGAIRWFNGDSHLNPPFDLVVSTFEACFDSTKQLYPGMRDQAYFSAQAILKISIGARNQSHRHASKYPIPAISSSSFQYADPDLHHAICMLECNAGPGRPIFNFPEGGVNTHTHSLWMSNLLVDMAHLGPNPTLKASQSYFSVAITNNQAVIANTLLVWYMLLGGHVEEETFWVSDKSYVMVSFSSFISVHLILHIPVTHWKPS